jgi:transcriptional regulator with XRE-family HTH domain
MGQTPMSVREERVRSLMAARGIASVAQLAEKSGINRTHIYNLWKSDDAASLATLKRLASTLRVKVGDLVEDRPIEATPYDKIPAYRQLIDTLERVDAEDRAEIVSHALWTAERARPRIPSSNLVLFPVKDDTSGDFPEPPIPLGEWIEKDTDTPRPLHAWIVPIDHEAAAGIPRQEDDWLIPTTQLLNSVREVRDGRTKVVKVFGDSMHPVLRNGWKVLLDPSRTLFQPGKIVVVYIRDEGTTMGVLAQSGERWWIQKRNPDYGGPVEIHLRSGEWYPVGTVTTIVEAPVEVE